MGSALAQRLMRAGHVVLGFDIDRAAREALVASGGKAADCPADVFGAADVVVLSLPNATVVASVLDAAGDKLHHGTLVIDTTTGDPWQVEAIGARLAERGVG